MSNTPNAPVIVVTEEKKRRKGIIWIAGGAALAVAALGGGTFALWSANDSFNGGTITAGDLNLVQTADTAFYDVSADRQDATETLPGTDGTQPGHLIDDATWRIVPGDKVAAAFSADVTLEGDNLVAKLSAAGLDSVTTGTNEKLTWSYEIYSDDTLVVSESVLPTAADAPLLYLSAPQDGQDDGEEDATFTGTLPADGATAATSVFKLDQITADATTADFTVVIYGTFDATAGDAGQEAVDADGVYTDQTEAATGTREDALTVEDLSAIRLDLQQVRDTGAIFG